MNDSCQTSVSPKIKPLIDSAGTLPCNPVDASEGVEGGDDQADEDRETEEESGEVRNSRKAGQPRMPAKQEKDEHERTHVPFRSWCEHCVRGQAS